MEWPPQYPAEWTVQWHLYPAKDGAILPLSFDTVSVPIFQHCHQLLEDKVNVPVDLRNFSWLANCRSFLGYCDPAIIHLGTEEAKHDEMTYTDLKSVDGLALSLQSVTIGVGYQGFINVEADIELPHRRKLRTEQASPDNYGAMLFQATRRSVLIYETTLRKAFMVPLITVLLQMVVKWARINKVPLPDTAPGNAQINNNAARSYLSHNRNYQLPGSGDRLETQVICLYNRAKACLDEPKAKRTLLSFLQKRAIYGWELMDLINGDDEFRRKQDITKGGSPSWTSLASSLGCFVCDGLGEIITPAVRTVPCPTWDKRLAAQQYLLVASTACLELLFEKQGKKSLQLSDGIYWTPIGDQGSLFAPCNHGAGMCRKNIQIIDKKSPAAAKSALPQSGAIVFK